MLGAVALSIYAVRIAPLDAIPDISEPQFIVYAKWACSPQLLEAKVAAPVIESLVGWPGVRTIRTTSHMGYCFIYVILDDESQRQSVQQRVVERLSALRPQLPADAAGALAPNASSMGWIYQYALVDRTSERDLRDLRVLDESRIKPTLQAVAGVASVGGLE